MVHPSTSQILERISLDGSPLDFPDSCLPRSSSRLRPCQVLPRSPSSLLVSLSQSSFSSFQSLALSMMAPLLPSFVLVLLVPSVAFLPSSTFTLTPFSSTPFSFWTVFSLPSVAFASLPPLLLPFVSSTILLVGFDAPPSTPLLSP